MVRPHQAHRNRARARARPRARKWGWVGEVWKYCALSELHPRSGLGLLKGRQIGPYVNNFPADAI
jgi:hypothetical protein